ncbi:MAG: O-antigen ligase family protein [Candidatus Tectomicrobia bacterium]|nr:O-antigen ligase family protein [Candidatus Tectomicrobia bacterium]
MVNGVGHPPNQPLSNPLPQVMMPGQMRQTAAPSTSIPKPLQWCFFLFMFTLPFENMPLTFIPAGASPTKYVGLLFFGLGLLYPKVSFRYFPSILWWFIGYVAIYLISGAFIENIYYSAYKSRFITLVQLLTFFLMIYNILRQGDLSRKILIAFISSSVIASLGLVFELPGFVAKTEEIVGERTTVSGFNANEFATVISLATLSLIGILLDKRPKSLVYKLVLMSLSLPLMTALIYTGSRTACLVLLLGAVLLTLPYRSSKRKMAAVVWVSLAIISAIYITITDPAMSSRWTLALEKGDTAGRDKIFLSSLEMFTERPLIGWGPVQLWYELGARTGSRTRDTHNLFLHLLLEVGIIGTIPFCLGLYQCYRAAWKARTGSLGLLPFALVIAVLASNMALTYLTRKPVWVMLAIAPAAAVVASSNPKSKTRILVRRLAMRHPL